MTRDSALRALRTFIISFLALWIPYLIGFLNDLANWANGNDKAPFPDISALGEAGVSAAAAALIALINLVWNAVEDGVGRGMFRAVPPRTDRNRRV